MVSVRPVLLGHPQPNDVSIGDGDYVPLPYEHPIEPRPVSARVLDRRLGLGVLGPHVVPVDGEVLGTHPEIAVVDADLTPVGPAESDAVLLDVFIDANPSCRCGNTPPRLLHSKFLLAILSLSFC